jgi:hypothetical protein
MATIGVDCEIILDGQGYLVAPGSYRMRQPRVRSATVRADNNEGYRDLGPGKRVWQMVILAINDLTKYDGTPTGLTGQQYRDTLRASYLKVNTTLTYSDPLNSNIQVRFDEYAETVADLRVQQAGPAGGGPMGLSYHCAITLVEA